ncbi:heat shock Hsp70 [Fusarium pseudoanthophilum]|uniref:Heat shock Hsp70 n=1 Tax=Fusarium pseudoanthophilum TaxID=48495 RepID=A0A8H5NKS9_9HYPO|nr:heat shock Hsp70 [Fusarium pseudoanthophilum]
MSANPSVETSPFLVVGVDFGTTYTGVAYTLSNDPDLRSVTIIQRWPGAGNQTRPKVPTEISYGPSDEKRWGWQLRAGSPRYGGFKLLLDPGAGSRAYNDEHLALTLDPGNQSTQLLLHPGKSATDMVSDYLRLVHKEVMESLQRRFPNTLNDLKIKFVITTPAMWSPAAQHNTMIAAKAAGFGSRSQDIIESVTEPEAAASYALREFNSFSVPNSGVNDNSGWQVGKQVIMCDAGGGTVDLVSYEIDQVKPYLRVSETTRPRGGLCGATSLDQRFLQLVRDRLGQQAHLLDGARSGRGSRLMLSFDDAKRNFGSNDLEDEELIEHGIRALSSNSDNGIDREYLTFDDMKSIFDPVVDTIQALIESVMKEARKNKPDKPLVGIILVGGFGESVYLYKRLNTWAAAQNPKLFVGSPKNSWAAIAQGAVCYGLEGIVHRRILPCHWGVELADPYKEGIHDPIYNYHHDWYGTMYNKDTITWFAKMKIFLKTSDLSVRRAARESARFK